MTVRDKPKLSISVGNYLGGNLEAATDFVLGAERLGINSVWSGEAWGQDAATILAYLAARTERIKLGTGIFQISARAPSMTAMTALSLNALSEGRFLLGLGVSGPQVVEGLHGQPFKAPLTRLKETIEICDLAFAGGKLCYNGKAHTLPLPKGAGKAIRLGHKPVQIPIYLATLGPNALVYTGERADGWLGTSFSPDHADAHFAYIKEGAQKAGRALSDIDIGVAIRVEIGDDVPAMIERRRQGVAFNMGGMGSATTNFYNNAFQRAGYQEDAETIRSLWVSGKHAEAAQRVPDEMVTEFQAIGTRGMVRARLQKYKDVGVNTFRLGLDSAPIGKARLDLLENIVDLVASLD